MKFNILVVGGGTGGCILAEAMAKLGYRVCIVDVKKREEIGEKVCGDAVGKHHFDNLGISYPKKGELENKVVGIDVFSPDLKTVFRIEEKSLHGFVIDRYAFGQRLLKDALDEGAELFDQNLVLKPIFNNGFIVGIKTKNVKNNIKREFYGDCVIDASGMAAALRKKMPIDWGIERKISAEDIEICYREIRETKKDIKDPTLLKIFLNQQISPKGYYWIFPKGEKKVNVGLGVKSSSCNPRLQLHRFVLSQPLFQNSTVLKAGGGVVSTRRPLNSMVGNGILFIGDSACQPNPIHGGGIGPSMLAGKLASKVLNHAFDKEDFTREFLWAYNIKYMKSYGAKAASLDVFRIFLEKCSDEDLNHGMKNKLIKEEDILKVASSLEEELKLNITEKAKRVFRGLEKLSFLRKLSDTAKKMRIVKKLYLAYPLPQGFQSWVHQINDVFNKLRQ